MVTVLSSRGLPFLIPTQGSGLQVDRQICMKLKGLSTGCRHLLTRMLRADPRKRATISEVMRHPWFQIDCPQVRLQTAPSRLWP